MKVDDSPTDAPKFVDHKYETVGGTDWMNAPLMPPMMRTTPTAPDFAAIAARLLPFGVVDEHMVWPLAVYALENDDELGCVNFLVFSIEGRQLICSGTFGTREQAIEAGRADLQIRLKAVARMMEVGE